MLALSALCLLFLLLTKCDARYLPTYITANPSGLALMSLSSPLGNTRRGRSNAAALTTLSSSQITKERRKGKTKTGGNNQNVEADEYAEGGGRPGLLRHVRKQRKNDA
jgi:hypothetical protein